MNSRKIILSLLFALFAGSINSQELQTYKGDFHDFSYVYMLWPKATYQYYEDDDFTRIYHGDFSMTFDAEGTTAKRKRIGTLKGRFKHGRLDGDWTLVYPFRQMRAVNLQLVPRFYTAKVKCSFENGRLNGPVEVIVTNAANKVIGKSIVHFKNGRKDGELDFYMTEVRQNFHPERIKGQYENDRPVGKWTYTYDGHKGIIEYEDGMEKRNFMVDPRTGDKVEGFDNMGLNCLDYGTVTLPDLLSVFRNINNSTRHTVDDE